MSYGWPYCPIALCVCVESSREREEGKGRDERRGEETRRDKSRDELAAISWLVDEFTSQHLLAS